MKLYDCINEDLQAWIEKQHCFFVGTAPLSASGHVNLSPKGYDCFRIINDHQVCYMDMSGSGNETSAHLLENGRMTIMFCAFQGGPRILRLYGQGQVLLPTHPDYPTYLDKYYNNQTIPGTRQIIVCHVTRVQTSCGYGVPFMDFKEDRNTLQNFFDKKGEQGVIDYMKSKNRVSIDDLPTPQGQMFEQQESKQS